MFKFRMLRQSDLATECDACGARFDLMTGGTCERCRRILCERHLHGSWARRMLHEFRRPVHCVRCRHEAAAGTGGASDGADHPARAGRR